MSDEFVQLGEAPGIEQQIDSFARGELSRLVLFLDSGLAAPEPGLFLHLLQSLAQRILLGQVHARLIYYGRSVQVRAKRCVPSEALSAHPWIGRLASSRGPISELIASRVASSREETASKRDIWDSARAI